MCKGIKIVRVGSEKRSQNQWKFDQKTTIFGLFRFCQKVSIRFAGNFLLGAGKNFRLLLRSCRFFCFFFSRPFMKISKFSETVHSIFMKICSVFLHPKEAPACAKASKLYDWNVRNIPKGSPKMAKKHPFSIFSIFSKTVHTIQTNVCTVILHPKGPLYAQKHQNRMTGMLETVKISPKSSKNSHFRLFFRFSEKLSIRFERNFLQSLYTILSSFLCNSI